MVYTPPVKKVKMSEKSTKHKEEEESSVPKNGEDVVEQGERGDRPSGIVEPFFDPRQFTGLYGTDEDLERILRETTPFQTTSSDSEFSTPPIRQAPSRAETTSSESSDSDSESPDSDSKSSSPQFQEEKPEGSGSLKKAPELKKDLHLEKKPVEEGKGLQSFDKVLELEKNRQLEKFENSDGGWERSDSFEAVYGDGEEYQVDTRGEVSEGSIYVPTPKASPADGNYCLFGGEYMSKAEKMLLEKAMEESLKEQKDKEAEAVPVKDRLRFQQPATSSDRAVSVAKKTSPPPPFKEQFENVSWDVSEWYKGEIEPRPTEFWIPDSDVPSTSNFTDADAKRATDRIMMEFYEECRWAMRRKQRKMLE